tara:strand:+ start:4416 stop:4595 length:180 start_codon:yes stop_codon:yes gene_type:complete
MDFKSIASACLGYHPIFFGTDSEIRTHKLLILSQEGIPDSRHISINFFCAKGEIRTLTD